MIRVAVVDDHPAVRAGLHALLRSEPGLSPIAVPAAGPTTPATVLAANPDVALLDGQLAVGSGLELCLRLTQTQDPPPVVLYSAYLDAELAIAARLAGAAAALSKAVPLDEVLETLRAVAAGGTRFPPIAPAALRRCAERLEPEDLPILSLLAHGTSRRETANTLGISTAELIARLTRIITVFEHALMPASIQLVASREGG